MKKQNLNLILLLLFPLLGFCQEIKRCAIGENVSKDLKHRHEVLNLKIEEYYRKNGRISTFEQGLVTIPVVIHIIHNNQSNIIGGPNNSNISDEQVISQIKVLNEDYRRKNGTRGFNDSPIGADLNIEFKLAQTDPNGKLSSGIVRVYHPKNQFDVFDDNYLLSELSYWDSSKYLNIWVTTLSNGYLGFGEFPGGVFDGLELEDVDERIDGVIIDHTAFGSKTGTSVNGIYSFGRTLTHEIGHWFGLIHTWGDEFCGDDFCNDTPPTERGNNSIRCNVTFSNCKGERTRNMIENYMDYTPDSCMNIFTSDQSLRIRAIFEVSKRRKKLIANAQFNLPTTDKLALNILENPLTSNELVLQILVKDLSNYGISIFDSQGRIIFENNFIDSPSRILKIPKEKLRSGVFIISAYNEEEKVSKKLIVP